MVKKKKPLTAASQSFHKLDGQTYGYFAALASSKS